MRFPRVPSSTVAAVVRVAVTAAVRVGVGVPVAAVGVGAIGVGVAAVGVRVGAAVGVGPFALALAFALPFALALALAFALAFGLASLPSSGGLGSIPVGCPSPFGCGDEGASCGSPSLADAGAGSAVGTSVASIGGAIVGESTGGGELASAVGPEPLGVSTGSPHTRSTDPPARAEMATSARFASASSGTPERMLSANLLHSVVKSGSGSTKTGVGAPGGRWRPAPRCSPQWFSVRDRRGRRPSMRRDRCEIQAGDSRGSLESRLDRLGQDSGGGRSSRRHDCEARDHSNCGTTGSDDSQPCTPGRWREESPSDLGRCPPSWQQPKPRLRARRVGPAPEPRRRAVAVRARGLVDAGREHVVEVVLSGHLIASTLEGKRLASRFNARCWVTPTHTTSRPITCAT